jgi:hypothetical protein
MLSESTHEAGLPSLTRGGPDADEPRRPPICRAGSHLQQLVAGAGLDERVRTRVIADEQQA